MYPPIDQLTADGYDLQFGTNVLGTLSPRLNHSIHQVCSGTGHYYFTKLLLPTMIATAKRASDGKARIVNTSSVGHLFGDLDFDTFKDSPTRRKTSTQSLYNQSKFVRPQSCPLRDRLKRA